MQSKFSRAIASLLTVFMLGTAAAAPANKSGFKTAQPTMLDPVMAGVEITPLLTVGDVLSSGYRFESIPDGISLRTRGQRRVALFSEPRDQQGSVPIRYSGTDGSQ